MTEPDHSRWYVVVTYDITDDTRRTQAADWVLRFGERVQMSVYDCLIDDASLAQLKQGMERIIEPSLDSVRYYVLCRRCARSTQVQGTGDVHTHEELVII